ncbi:MAG: TetR/AcrR family transcriptional regulator [Myxococcales bacterium]|nr:MAG: TetR/AcrR family transcriptional regulator [Myxococcales bacterium]
MDGSNAAIVAVSLTDARQELVRQRILQGACALLSRGEGWTFAGVAKAAEVPERTIYRYFATREDLLHGIFELANQRTGFQGELPTSAQALTELVRRCFPGFDALAPVIEELLSAPEGRQARLRQKAARRRASLALVRTEAPELGPADATRVAAVLQLLGQAATWQALRDYWDMDGAEAAEASALAIELLLLGARSRANGKHGSKKRRAKAARAKEDG